MTLIRVFWCLQPFMITVSVTVAANTVRKLSDKHDADVIEGKQPFDDY